MELTEHWGRTGKSAREMDKITASGGSGKWGEGQATCGLGEEARSLGRRRRH